MTRAKATRAVLTVGEGRGFVVECDHQGQPMRIVITAAHCLPRLPSCPSGLDQWGWTYEALLGPLGQMPTVWAECIFVDIVGDVAVLGQPDNQELFEQAESYDRLVDAVTPLPITDALEDGPAWLLSLDRKWHRCRVRHLNGPLWIEDAAAGIKGGMSGSPIITKDGAAIGVVSISGGSGDTDSHTGGGPNPHLAFHLPSRYRSGDRFGQLPAALAREPRKPAKALGPGDVTRGFPDTGPVTRGW
jgi:hypothetical protein